MSGGIDTADIRELRQHVDGFGVGTAISDVDTYKPNSLRQQIDVERARERVLR